MSLDVAGADLILVGGSIRTMDPARPSASAIATAGDRIVGVGGDGEVLATRRARTRVLDLRGRTVLPGFQDAHVHPVSAGLDLVQCALHDLHTESEYLDRIATYAAEHAELPWIVGGGWSMAAFATGFGHREALDRVIGGRPAFFDSRDGHDAWVNSAALGLAGIDASTGDPPLGRIGRDPDGAPSGALHESALELVRSLIPAPSEADLDHALQLAQRTLVALGITAWHDASVSPAYAGTYQRAEGRGDLAVRVIGAMTWDETRGLEQIDELAARRAASPGPRYTAGSVKFFLDGIVENRTALVLDPYLDADGSPTDERGRPGIEPGVLHEAVSRLDRLGFQCHVHAIGEGAVRLALDALETARHRNGPTDNRHHIAHIQVIHPADVPRFGRLGVVANAQPYWACASEQLLRLNDPFLGPERARWQYPFASLLRSGARLAMGSDWAVSTPNPLWEMEVAITRVEHPSRVGESWLPEERLTLDQALEAFTAGSAWVNHLDDAGRLRIGDRADLVILDRDVHAPGAGQLGDTRVAGTLIGGSFAYAAADLD